MSDKQNGSILRAERIQKQYVRGSSTLSILKGLDIEIKEGEDIGITGSSGAGKSTFLHILGTLDSPSLGRVFYRGEDLGAKGPAELAQFRNSVLGFVFQFHHLLPEFTALENVLLPAEVGRKMSKEVRQRADELFALMQLSDRKHHFPSELSGGEQQRVAIARSLILRPEILMADEPTGNLDAENSKNIQDLFFQLKREYGLTLVTVTHDADFASKFSRRLDMKDGLWCAD